MQETKPLWFSCVVELQLLVLAPTDGHKTAGMREKKEILCHFPLILLTEAFLPIFSWGKKTDKDQLMRLSRIHFQGFWLKWKKKNLETEVKQKVDFLHERKIPGGCSLPSQFMGSGWLFSYHSLLIRATWWQNPKHAASYLIAVRWYIR